MKLRWFSVLLILGLSFGLLMAIGCSDDDDDDDPQTNHAPQITSVTANPVAVYGGETSTLTVSATDPDDDALEYAWSASQGSLSATNTASVTYTAPTTEGTYTISVTVTDEADNTATGSVQVVVQATGTPIPEAPESGSEFEEGDIVFEWGSVDGASEYTLEVSDASDFSSIVDTYTGSETTHTLAVSDLTANTTYYWHVKAGSGSWSTHLTFTIPSDIIILSGTIVEDIILENNKTYILRGNVFFGNDQNNINVTIEPGTYIYGESSTLGTFIVARGSMIDARGTVDAPIVMTSDKNAGDRGRGDWGGLIINGLATLNTGEEAWGEGSTGWYGGNDDSDNSGYLQYVRVEWAGQEISPENELNGIAFQGVGNGTTVDHIQVHMNSDDGIEFFGGTVNLKYAYTTGIGDDNFDWTDGWRGKGQYWVAQQYDDAGDQGFECDNSSEDNLATPRALPTIYNVTLAGQQSADIGMLLREGTGANIYNAIVMNFGDEGVRLDHNATYTESWDDANGVLNGTLIVDHSIFYNCDGGLAADGGDADPSVIPFTAEQFMTTLNTNNQEVDPALTDAFNFTSPNYLPTGSSPALSGAASPSDSWFDDAGFIGAFGSDNWLNGWIQTERN